MFDRIDRATLLGPDLRPLLALYRDELGFIVTASHRIADASDYHRLWRLPPGPLDVRTLDKPGRPGGGLRLVGAPSLPPVGPRTMARPGPFALDFYVRDLHGLCERLRGAGYRFRSEPLRYQLFGTNFEVDEVLLEAPLGFVHALVEYLPDRHRCALADLHDEQVSELVAAITVVEDVEEGLATLRDALGGQVYFDEFFEGPAVEKLIGLPAGTRFRAVLLRGPSRGNARAELMATVADAGSEVELPRAHPALTLSLSVPDLDVASRVVSAHGELTGPFAFGDGPLEGTRAAALWTSWGGVIELTETTRS